MAQRPKTREK